MEFDLSKVASAVNAEDFQNRTLNKDITFDSRNTARGWFADSLKELKGKVVNDSWLDALEEVRNDSKRPFVSVSEGVCFAFFYPKEKTYRPYKNGDEMFENFKELSDSDKENFDIAPPVIWVKSKKSGAKTLIYGLEENKVLVGTDCFISYKALFDCYTYLDGSPCGLKE